jgi:uncharacterized protein (DUF1501 family)
MLTIRGGRVRFCDGISRRSFLQIGSLAMSGFTLPGLLRAEARAARPSRHKAIIHIFMRGGPSQIDTFDPKPDATAEIRGEFRPIRTRIPGVTITEHMPRLARIADKLIFIRSVVGSDGHHGSFQAMHGLTKTARLAVPGGSPALGSLIAKIQGSVHPAVPPFISLSAKKEDPAWYNNPGQPGCLGRGFAAFEPNASSQEVFTLDDITLDRLQERKRLLRSLDRLREDASPSMRGRDAHTQQAFDLLTSSQVSKALSIDGETSATRARYGPALPIQTAFNPGVSVTRPEDLLIARRLIEAGARYVTVAFGWWDWHGTQVLFKKKCFDEGRHYIPAFDQGVSALIEDLDSRGMLNDVTVLAWGEFGRTPKISSTVGRDHWPKVACALMAGGGMRGGRVIGATDRDGSEATDRPVSHEEIYATLYHNMGIDPYQTTYHDMTGRPHSLLGESYRPLRELVG